VPPNGIENCLLALQIFALACHVVAVVVNRYVPTWLWGKSGHIQTILYGKMGRVDSPMPRGCRCAKLLADGATITYDIFQPLGNLKTAGQSILFQLSALVTFFSWLTCVIKLHNSWHDVQTGHHVAPSGE